MRRRRAGAAGGRSAALWRYALTAVLGLPARSPREPSAARVRRDPSASSYEESVGAANQLQFGRAYWLPPFGRGNGLDALFWAPLAELPADRVDAALAALRDDGIPAWAASAGERSAAAPPPDVPFRLWTASGQLDDAQDVLLRVLAA